MFKNGQQQKAKQVQISKPNVLLTPKWKQRTHDTHQKHLDMYKDKQFRVAFLGDSMMERWLNTEYWDTYFSEYANLGVGGDCIEHLLYRLNDTVEKRGILDVIKVDQIILMIGTNNADRRSSTDIVAGVKLVIDTVITKQQDATIVLYGLTMRNDVPDEKMNDINNKLNDLVKSMNNPKLSYRYVDVPKDELLDNVHLNENGYKRWFDDMNLVLLKK